MAKVLVTGATGNVGQEVAKALLAQQIPVKAAAREAERVKQLAQKSRWPKDYEAVALDYADSDSIAAALDGVDRVFLVTPTMGPVAEMVAAFLDVAKNSDVKHIVRLSGMRTVHEPSVTHAESERLIAESGIAYTFLRPNFFMQNFSTFYADGIKYRDTIALPAGEEPISFIDVRDIADVAVVTFTQDGHAGQAYTLTGGEAITHYDVARALSEVLGRTITYINMPEDQFREVLKAAGRPEAVANGVIHLYAPVKQMLAAPVTDDVQRVTGKAPRTIHDYARDYASAWARA
jgi:uncharacterized protein YbjT (DUF2867 family)